MQKKLLLLLILCPLYTPVYRNVFREAGYRQRDIDAKLDKAWSNLFEGPDKVYFEVGDSMGYVSDLKNHDARTEGLSYGMMIAQHGLYGVRRPTSFHPLDPLGLSL